MRISVAIPTYKRPDDIKKCVASVVGQTLPPAEVLIIDDDVLPTELINDLRQKVEAVGARFVYHRKNHSHEPRGLSFSRHLALEQATHDVLIIDDDIVLAEDCLAWLAQAKQEEGGSSVIGIGGLIRNNRHQNLMERFFNYIFGLTSSLSWDVNASGFQVWNDFISTRQSGYYVHGGFCLYNRAAALSIGFPPFQGGRPGLEDVYFSLRAKQLGFHYILEPRAGCWHYHSSGGRDSQYRSGFQESQNRKVIFRDLCESGLIGRIRFYRANKGWILRQFLAGHFFKGLGMLSGFLCRINNINS
ncbi:glycosyltransferase [Patescibacteria group bacterium]|nr:glycosyltransferase [Patescibacteria group bacterium]